MREREYSLVDIKLGKVIKTQRVDTGMGVLMPVANKERSIVYLAGRVSPGLLQGRIFSVVNRDNPGRPNIAGHHCRLGHLDRCPFH